MQSEDLVLALVSVNGATAATSVHGDHAAMQTLNAYYAAAQRAAQAARGRVVKVIGDGMILCFPSAAPHAALAALRRVQQDSAAVWSGFDAGCRVVIKAGAGPVATGPMGPPDDQRPDVFGHTLNTLFRMEPGDGFAISGELQRRLDGTTM